MALRFTALLPPPGTGDAGTANGMAVLGVVAGVVPVGAPLLPVRAMMGGSKRGDPPTLTPPTPVTPVPRKAPPPALPMAGTGVAGAVVSGGAGDGASGAVLPSAGDTRAGVCSCG